MPSNVEIKARIPDPDATRRLAAAIGEKQSLLRQVDTFFATERGRLKLREFSPDDGELIYYERPHQSGPKESRYWISKTRDPRGLCAALTAALGTGGVVRKVRHLYLTGQTRIHLDEVDGLGHFVELEVVLKDGQTAADGIAVAQDFMARLGIRSEDLVEEAYVDLVHNQQTNRSLHAPVPPHGMER